MLVEKLRKDEIKKGIWKWSIVNVDEKEETKGGGGAYRQRQHSESQKSEASLTHPPKSQLPTPKWQTI